MGKSTMSMVIFNSYVTNYQRVNPISKSNSNFSHLLSPSRSSLSMSIFFAIFRHQKQPGPGPSRPSWVHSWCCWPPSAPCYMKRCRAIRWPRDGHGIPMGGSADGGFLRKLWEKSWENHRKMVVLWETHRTTHRKMVVLWENHRTTHRKLVICELW